MGTPQTAHPEQLRSRGGQAYVVLTLCRMLYTVDTGQVVTKRVAATWARTTLDARWWPLIGRARVGRHNPAAETRASGEWRTLTGRAWDGLHTEAVSPEEVHATLAFLQYTIERSYHVERPVERTYPSSTHSGSSGSRNVIRRYAREGYSLLYVVGRLI